MYVFRTILRLIYFISPNSFIPVLTTAYQWTLFQHLTHDTQPVVLSSPSCKATLNYIKIDYCDIIIHSLVCLAATDLQPLPKQVLQKVRSSASSMKCWYLLSTIASSRTRLFSSSSRPFHLYFNNVL